MRTFRLSVAQVIVVNLLLLAWLLFLRPLITGMPGVMTLLFAMSSIPLLIVWGVALLFGWRTDQATGRKYYTTPVSWAWVVHQVMFFLFGFMVPDSSDFNDSYSVLITLMGEQTADLSDLLAGLFFVGCVLSYIAIFVLGLWSSYRMRNKL
ncbi:Uncharacterised protein [Corynebacterium renale]|uniref:hypothetical protein n=1 Tax=Corynebacterium renale TaxID=1724 RepID=UPI000DA286FC|nr:hypothetical protein [Corynebacterium renale]SQG63667.1 Uncharacterised protein [Corynebacterium renale]STD01464.1 Uncharacterised protein [Corynebacterium renale]